MKYLIWVVLILSLIIYEEQLWIRHQWIVHTGVNVQDYLNYPDWYDDCTTGIQNAINAVDKQSWWQFKGVYFPPGTYFTRSVDFRREIYGSGKDCLIIELKGELQ